MSTQPLSFFLVQVSDIPDTQRVKHTPEHIKATLPLIENGIIVAGGGLLPDGVKMSDADARATMNGSFIVMRGATREEVKETLAKDPYYTSGEVWDIASIKITPVFVGVPKVE
ncbi:hypothetical protein C8Q80DRAFT_1097649 [Daedaleopsis nitida]|nr:hypothetical protein C8Q80DRAFT_1097649 [Daedaleopsis nitida]